MDNRSKTTTDLVPPSDNVVSCLDSNGDLDFYLFYPAIRMQRVRMRLMTVQKERQEKQKKKVHHQRKIKNEDNTRGIPVWLEKLPGNTPLLILKKIDKDKHTHE